MDECVGHTPSVQSSLGDTGVRVNFYIGWGGGGSEFSLFKSFSIPQCIHTYIYTSTHVEAQEGGEREIEREERKRSSRMVRVRAEKKEGEEEEQRKEGRKGRSREAGSE